MSYCGTKPSRAGGCLVLGICVLAAFAAGLGLRAGGAEEDAPAGGTATKEPASTDLDAQVENWVRYAMPGARHRLLEKLTGRWEMAVTYRMAPGTPAVESRGTCERRWILGGRFVQEEFDGGDLGLPFAGLALYGYDSFEERYTCVWVDTTSTAVTTSSGVCEADCRSIAFTGTHGDPWSGRKKASRGVTRFLDEDRHVLELFEPDGEGREFKVMEIVYKKATGSGLGEETRPGSRSD